LALAFPFRRRQGYPSGERFVSSLLAAVAADADVLDLLTEFSQAERRDRRSPSQFIRFETLMQMLAEPNRYRPQYRNFVEATRKTGCLPRCVYIIIIIVFCGEVDFRFAVENASTL
jgi:hypothetical protein